ncbi:MAG: tRNA (adenosine(37)-N6)-threonylcarbamoyltransferase complex ATPase subunit type 1 TsaE [Hyphomicrobiales bacterium]|nr:MAG: tRNA (adenosine(37)-N6)-threonylcarbamoyltransferase complex ATPase subunit type 1 TsaE [Hyphomicrobiales bacterium]
MHPDTSLHPVFTRELSSEYETQLLGRDIALALKAGDCLGLRGDLGAGKSTLARAIIRHLADDLDLEVPSPTFTLEQVYATNPAIHHFDFYRLGDPSEVLELGLDEALEGAVAIIEWPQNAEGMLPDNLANIQIDIGSGDNRKITISGPPKFLCRIRRSMEIRTFLRENWGENIVRRPLTGDASTRAYELVTKEGETRLLMNAARQPDGPPVRDGKPYSQIAHLAEDVSAFVAIDLALRDAGFYAPEIFAQDLDEGLLLTEFMGQGGVIDAERKPIRERYLAAAELLVQLHLTDWQQQIKVSAAVTHQIPKFDRDAMTIEVELLVDWYAPSVRGEELPEADLQNFNQIWQGLIGRLQNSEQTLVLRDYHSPNLIWREDAHGHNRLGLIDFQDAVIGPSTYDLASLAQDARVDISEKLEEELVSHYIELRVSAEPDFDVIEFRQLYMIAAAERASKILGIFVRLHKRDKKPIYLKHIPRIRDYLERCFKNPALGEYQDWFVKVLDRKKDDIDGKY